MRMLFLLFLTGTVLLTGCKKKEASTPPSGGSETKPVSPDSAAPATSPAMKGGNTNYQAGAGAAQNVRQAARRTVALNDMHQIGVIIQQYETLNNRMPNAQEIQSELRQTPNLLALITGGSIILTGTTNRSGLWAYEAEADTKGGIGLVGGTASRYSADDIKAFLQNR